ncbi:MAG: hypothetical protein AAF682_07920 [Planctomycetota bacterium]
MTSGGSYDYKAFLCYRRLRMARSNVAAELQEALERFRRPWNRPRAFRVFRDVTDGHATADGQALLYDALDRSEFLIVVATPDAARSAWTRREMDHWLRTRGTDNLLVVLAQGELAPGENAALPEHVLARLDFAERSFYEDVRSLPDEAVDARNDAFLHHAAGVAAPLWNDTRANLWGKHRRERRRLAWAQRGLTALLATLLVAVLLLYLESEEQRERVAHQLADRWIADGAEEPVPAEALRALAQGIALAPDGPRAGLGQARLVDALRRVPSRERIRVSGGFERVAIAPDLRRIALGRSRGDGELWLFDRLAGKHELLFDEGRVHFLSALAFCADGERLLVAARDPRRPRFDWLQLFDLSGAPARLLRERVAPATGDGARPSPDGSLVLNGDGFVLFAELGEDFAAPGGRPRVLAAGRDAGGAVALIGDSDDQASVHRLPGALKEPEARFPWPVPVLRPQIFATDEGRFVQQVGGAFPVAVLVGRADGAEPETLELEAVEEDAALVALSGDGEHAVLLSDGERGTRRMELVELASPEWSTRVPLPAARAAGAGERSAGRVWIHRSGHRVARLGGGGTLTVIERGATFWSVELGAALAVELSPDLERAVAVDERGQVRTHRLHPPYRLVRAEPRASVDRPPLPALADGAESLDFAYAGDGRRSLRLVRLADGSHAVLRAPGPSEPLLLDGGPDGAAPVAVSYRAGDEPRVVFEYVEEGEEPQDGGPRELSFSVASVVLSPGAARVSAPPLLDAWSVGEIDENEGDRPYRLLSDGTPVARGFEDGTIDFGLGELDEGRYGDDPAWPLLDALLDRASSLRVLEGERTARLALRGGAEVDVVRSDSGLDVRVAGRSLLLPDDERAVEDLALSADGRWLALVYVQRERPRPDHAFLVVLDTELGLAAGAEVGLAGATAVAFRSDPPALDAAVGGGLALRIPLGYGAGDPALAVDLAEAVAEHGLPARRSRWHAELRAAVDALERSEDPFARVLLDALER